MKFDTKKFTKSRLELKVPNHSNIRKLWTWNDVLQKYDPAIAKCYVAKRKSAIPGKRYDKDCFHDLAGARTWQNERSGISQQSGAKGSDEQTFKQVLSYYRQMKYGSLAESTQELYDSLIGGKSFAFLTDIKMSDLNANMIDDWIQHMRLNCLSANRETFKKELDLLKAILSFYADRNDDFQSPIKSRHRNDIVIKRITKSDKNVTEQEFFLFRKHLELHFGLKFAAMATIQFYSSLRVGEVAALKSNDFIFNQLHPQKSRIVVKNSVRYNKKKEAVEIKIGFKNSASNGGSKDQYLSKESYEYALKVIHNLNPDAPIFVDDENKLFSYRRIEYAYTKAFKLAGLNYSATHVMRHGGASHCYDVTGGDLGAVQQLLGNSDLKSVQVYAKRSKRALQDYTKLSWGSEAKANSQNESEPQKATGS